MKRRARLPVSGRPHNADCEIASAKQDRYRLLQVPHGLELFVHPRPHLSPNEAVYCRPQCCSPGPVLVPFFGHLYAQLTANESRLRIDPLVHTSPAPMFPSALRTPRRVHDCLLLFIDRSEPEEAKIPDSVRVPFLRDDLHRQRRIYRLFRYPVSENAPHVKQCAARIWEFDPVATRTSEICTQGFANHEGCLAFIVNAKEKATEAGRQACFTINEVRVPTLALPRAEDCLHTIAMFLCQNVRCPCNF